MAKTRNKTSPETRIILGGQTRQHKDGRRHLSLTDDERLELAQHAKIEEAVAFFLDLENDLTNKEIADRLGLGISSLKRLTQTAEFTRVYEDALAMLGHSPRLMATAQSLPDLLPAAFRTLRRLVTDAEVPDAVALKAAERILAINRVGAEHNDEDPRDFQNFMNVTGAKIEGNLNILTFNIPESYKAMFEKSFGAGVDAEVVPEGLIEGPDTSDQS